MAATIVAPFCAQLRTGEHWTTPAAWYMARAFEQVPAGFVPAGATPLEDLRVLPFGPPFGDPPAANTVTLGTMHPLSAGRHTVDRYWRFGAMHCDGLGTDTTPGYNCFPAGETFYGQVAFDVLPASQ